MRIDAEFARHWSILLGCIIGLMVSTSPAFFTTAGLFFESFADRYGWSRGDSSIVVALAALTAGLLTPVAGYAIDRFGVRPVILVGCCMLPASLLAFAIVPLSYPVFLALGVGVGLAGSIMGPGSFLNLPPQYFERHLGLAIGFAVLGLGLGQMALPFVVERFIHWFGDRDAWIALAALVATVGLTNAATLIRDNPALPRGRRARETISLPGYEFDRAMRDPFFWQTTIAFLLIVMVISGVALHLPPFLADRGYSSQAAAGAISLVGFGSIVARLITGAMLDRMSPAVPAVLFFGGQVGGLLLLWSGAGGIAPFAAALLIGGSLGAEGDMMPFVLRRVFGMRAFGKIYGVSFGCFQLGAVAGTIIMGRAYDMLGSYDRILIIFSITSTFATALMIVAANNMARRELFISNTNLTGVNRREGAISEAATSLP